MLIAYPLQQWLQTALQGYVAAKMHKILSFCFLQWCASRWWTSEVL